MSGSGRYRKSRVLFALVAATATIISGIAVYGFLEHQRAQKTAALSSEPFPALWQENFSGTPSSISAFSNGIAYFLVDSNTTWSSGNLTWEVYAVELGNGKLVWNHNVTLASPGNIQPSLYVRNNTLFFIDAASAILINGVQIPGSNESLSAFMIPFNTTTGQVGTPDSIGIPLSFGSTGDFSVYGTHLYLAWISHNGKYYANVSAYSAFSGKSPSLIWKTSIEAPGSYNTNVALIIADSHFLLIPLWNLVGLNPVTGNLLFSSEYSHFSTDSSNAMNGALINSTFYYVSENRITSNLVDFNLMGMNLTSLSTIVNVTVGSASEGLYPLAVRQMGQELVIDTSLNAGSYAVTGLSGNILWKSSSLTYTSLGEKSVTPGYPAGILSNGNWILTSVSWPSGSSNITTQYFEEVSPSSGGLIWMHTFTYSGNSSLSMFLPPSLLEPQRVLVISTDSSFMLYRWGNSVGCAVI